MISHHHITSFKRNYETYKLVLTESIYLDFLQFVSFCMMQWLFPDSLNKFHSVHGHEFLYFTIGTGFKSHLIFYLSHHFTWLVFINQFINSHVNFYLLPNSFTIWFLAYCLYRILLCHRYHRIMFYVVCFMLYFCGRVYQLYCCTWQDLV